MSVLCHYSCDLTWQLREACWAVGRSSRSSSRRSWGSVRRSSKWQCSVNIYVILPSSFGRHVELLSDLVDPILDDHEALLGDLQNMWPYLTASGGMLSCWAIFSIQFSTIMSPWGPPKPRKAVLDGRLVLQQWPFTLKCGTYNNVNVLCHIIKNMWTFFLFFFCSRRSTFKIQKIWLCILLVDPGVKFSKRKLVD